MDSGVIPTSFDLLVACQKKADIKYLQLLLDSGVNPYRIIWDAPTSAVCILEQVIRQQDLEKLALVTTYPHPYYDEGRIQMGVALTLERLFAVAQSVEGESKKSISKEFALFSYAIYS